MDNKELIALYRERFLLKESLERLLLGTTEILLIDKEDELFMRLFELVGSKLSCCAMAWTRADNLEHFPEKIKAKTPEDWIGWGVNDWKSILQNSSSQLITNHSGEEILFIPIPIYLDGKQNNLLTESSPEELLYFFIKPNSFSEGKLLEQYVQFLGALFSMMRKIRFQSETHNQALKALTRALDSRDSYTRGHSERVARYATAIAQSGYSRFKLKMKKTEKKFDESRFIEICRLAGQLHDIGKIGMGDFLKVDRHLTDEEFIEMRCHVRESARILSEVDWFKKWEIDKAALFHHERLDGHGFLNKKDPEISYCSRVIALADSYDAMTSNRAYRDKSPWYEALDDLRVNSLLADKEHRQYDPLVFQAFEKAIIIDKNQSLLCPGYDEKHDHGKIEAIQNAIQKFENGDINGYLKELKNADLLFYDGSLPGYLKVLLSDSFKNLLKNHTGTPKNFSIGLFKWALQDISTIINNLKALNKELKQKGERNFKLSRYQEAFVVYSPTLPDRAIYNVFSNLSYETKSNSCAIVTTLERGNGSLKKIQQCYEKLKSRIEEIKTNPTPPKTHLYFWRDIRP